MIHWLFGPFYDYGFMARALVGSFVLTASACPLGVFLMLRRMSLAGDALAHGILPGAAAGYLLFGLAVVPMTIGGIIAGLAVALLAGAVSRYSALREDASLATFYLISLALGVVLISLRGSSVDLVHVLFGSVLALDDAALTIIGLAASLTFIGLAFIWRPLVAECLDPVFVRVVSGQGTLVHFMFLGLTVITLVGSFQALGTLLAVGLMMIPAAIARLWCSRLEPMMLVAVAAGALSCWLGLLCSFHWDAAAGPAITLAAGVLYGLSLIFAPRGVILSRLTFHRHRSG